MKKTFVTVSLIVALAAAANATSFERDNVVATSQAETAEMQSEVQSDEDIYRTTLCKAKRLTSTSYDSTTLTAS